MTKRTTQWHQHLITQVMTDPEMRTEYEAFKLQLDLAKKLKDTRQHADMTQENVAEKMATKKTVVARLEAAGGKSRHSPSLITLVKYANAVGCRLEIKLLPKRRASRSRG